MAILWVQNAQNFTTFTNTVAVTATTTTTGNLLVVGIWGTVLTSNPLARSVSDGTNTFKYAGTESVGVNTMEIWYAVNITGLTTPTITATRAATLASNPLGMQVVEVSGLATIQPLDYFQSTRFTAPGNAIINIGGFLPRTPNSFVFFCAGTPSATLTYTVGSGFTNLQQQGTSTDIGRMGSQTQVNSSATTLLAQLGGASNTQIASIAVAVFSDTNLPSPKFPLTVNNYQFLKVGDGMSVSEKIR